MSLLQSLISLGGSIVKDLYYNYVTLLLHGDGTNAAQNNTFLDSSSNALTITRNGNTTQGSFTPFSVSDGYWSNYFDGSSYFSLSRILDSSVDVTIEVWVYQTAPDPSNGSFLFGQYVLGGSDRTEFTTTGMQIGSTYISLSIPQNQWTHLAWVRYGNGTNNWTQYVNGKAVNQMTYTGTYQNTPTTIGMTPNLSNTGFPGYMSNLRVVKGTAVYTSNFTPSTAPLTAIANTVLLTCQSNRFKDNSTNSSSITLSGTPSVQVFSPFATSSPYSASVNGGSMYFDGSGDYLSAGSNSAFAFGTGAYTVEFWAYPSSISQQVYLFNDTTGGSGFYFETSGSAGFTIAPRATGTPALTGGYSSLQVNSWNHIVFCRASTSTNQTSIFVNGTRVANGTDGNNWTVTGPCLVGGLAAGIYMFSGYMSQVRVVKGSDVYGYNNSSITVPTSPLTSITNTQLLLSATNGGIFDNAASNDLETVGNAQISTTQSKFGTGSIYFDKPNSSYLTVPYSKNFVFEGDFTIELWFYQTSNSGFQTIIGQRLATNICPYLIAITAGGNLALYMATSGSGTWDIVNGVTISSITLNTWYHVALVRYGSSINIYLNGIKFGTTWTSSASLSYTSALGIGGSDLFAGYIDDLRITKGIARYLYNFAPPTKAYPDSGYSTYTPPTTDSYFGSTSLLLHGDGTNGAQNNTFLDGSSNAFSVTRNGNTTQGTFSPFSRAEGYWSNYFDGSSAYYFSGTGSATPLTFGTSTDFTMEGWFYLNATSGDSNYRTILSSYDNRTANYGYILGLYTTGTPQFEAYTNGLSLKSTTTLQVGTWYNFAYTRSGSNYYLFLNGVLQATGSGSYNSDNNSNWYVGRIPYASQTGYFNGYISNLRVVKGTALYTANYTPSTTPLTAISGTSLLTCQSNRFKDNSTNAYSVTINNGIPSVQTFIPFEPTTAYSASINGGSGYFDGSGDYLTVSNNTVFKFGTGDFTIEGWFYYDITYPGGYYTLFTIGNYTDGILMRVQNTSDSLYFAGGYTNWGGTTYMIPRSWNHIALVKQNGTVNVYVNGTSVLSFSDSSNLQPTGSVYVGTSAHSLGDVWNGYISNFRIVKGTAVYTSNFTPSTAPLTAISGTSLLLSGTNAGIYDSASTNDLETIGNAQISTSQSKFGGSSMYFGASSADYVKLLNNPINVIGDFTIEGWFYSSSVTSGSSSQVLFCCGGNVSDPNGLTGLALMFGYNSSASSTVTLYVSTDGSNFQIASQSVTGITSNNVWHHFAVVRVGGTFKVYINGIAVITSTTVTATTSIYNGTVHRVGCGNYTASQYTKGYIEDFRITKGICRYPYNFTIPASAYPNS